MKNSTEKLLLQYEKYNLSDILHYDKFHEFLIVHHSSSIEGSTLDEVETRLLLDEGLTPKCKPLDHSLMTRDHFFALKFITRKPKRKKIISPEFIQAVNAQVMRTTGGRVYKNQSGQTDASKGKFRKDNVSVRGSYVPKHSKVPQLIQELCEKINELFAKCKTPRQQLELSFYLNFHLVSIHPFYDGNGRTSRLLMNYLQKLCDLPMAIIFKEDKAEYFRALDKTRKENEYKIFKEFMYDQYEKLLKEEIKKAKQLEKKKEKEKPGQMLMF